MSSEADKARIAELEAALEPFVGEFERHRAAYERRGQPALRHFDSMPGSWPIELRLRMSDGRIARRALRGGSE